MSELSCKAGRVLGQLVAAGRLPETSVLELFDFTQREAEQLAIYGPDPETAIQMHSAYAGFAASLLAACVCERTCRHCSLTTQFAAQEMGAWAATEEYLHQLDVSGVTVRRGRAECLCYFCLADGTMLDSRLLNPCLRSGQLDLLRATQCPLPSMQLPRRACLPTTRPGYW